MDGYNKEAVMAHGRIGDMYNVVTIIEAAGMYGKNRAHAIEATVNQYAQSGYRLCSMTSTTIEQLPGCNANVMIVLAFEKIL